MKTKIFSIITLLILINQVPAVACHDATISCYTTVNLSLGPTCSLEITPEMVLYEVCPDKTYKVELFDGLPTPGNSLPNPIDGSYLGTNIVARVTDIESNNSCTADIILEDKTPPFIDFVGAPINLSCRDNFEEVISIGVFDNCGESFYQVSSIEHKCVPCEYDSIYITYELFDEYGNTASETKGFELVDFCFDAEFPEDVTYDCPPEMGEIPSITVNDSDEFCALSLSIDISDIRLGCDITRLYTVTEDCSGRSVTHTQIIDILEEDPPTIEITPPDGPITLDEFNDGFIPEYEAFSDCGILFTVTDQTIKESLSCNPVSFLALYDIYTVDVCGNSSPTEQVLVEVIADDPPKVKLSGRKNCSSEFIVTAETRDMAKPVSFSWSISNPLWSITAIPGTNQARVRSGGGKATVEVIATDLSGCIQSGTKKYYCKRSPFDFSNNEEIGVFPNPTSDKLNVTLVDEIEQIDIYTLDGKLIQSINNINAHYMSIDMDMYSPGIYFVSIMSGNDTIVEKIVKD
ncbi:MAG: T9SS type A sorting domain-containing protein [Saprospiraceae bacterium]|nr:T9SS type A sorting domain-containing protein [Saprospiraceae bacterium]